jgi:uncharacterized protein
MGSMAERADGIQRPTGARPESDRTTVQRHPERGRYERALINGILDEALICHLGFVHEGQPFVIPTIHARIESTLYVHGSPASRMLRSLSKGIAACLTATLLDGLVLARSAFATSMNYRSAVVLGVAEPVRDAPEQEEAFRAIVEHVVPGRSLEVRMPSPEELRRTLLLRMPIRVGSAKVRTGPPLDSAEDLDLRIWAGVLPIQLTAGAAVPDPSLRPGIPVPTSVTSWTRAQAAEDDTGSPPRYLPDR